MKLREITIRIPVQDADVLSYAASLRKLTLPGLCEQLLSAIAMRERAEMERRWEAEARALSELPEAPSDREPGPIQRSDPDRGDGPGSD